MKSPVWLLLAAFGLPLPLFAQEIEAPDEEDLLRRQFYWVQLQRGEMLNLGFEWQKNPNRSQTISISYVRRSGLNGGFSFQMAPASGMAVRYSNRFFFEKEFGEGIQGAYHGPLIMLRALHFNGSDIEATPDIPYDQANQPKPDLDLYVLSLQYMLGVQYITRDGLTIGGYAGAGARLKAATGDQTFSYRTTYAYGKDLRKLNENTGLLWMPSVHANFSVGWAF